ncbi:MAG TPA: protoporphyrinogen oxidase [Granulicella sp.]
MTSSSKKSRVAILGGGLAGLTAAWELARTHPSAEVALFEVSGRLGGIIETMREQGFTIECGPEAWVSDKPWARQLAEELKLPLLPSNDATRKTYILKDRQLVAMPDGMRMMVPADLDAVDASPLFSDEAKRAFHAEIERADELKANAPAEDESVASFVERHFGREVLETVGAPLLRGVFGGDVSSLSACAVMAPFVAMEREHGSLVKAIKARRNTSSNPIFTTLRDGLGSLIEAMTKAIPPEWVHLHEPVLSLRRESEGWAVRTAQGESRFDAVLLATPVHVAAELLREQDAEATSLMQMEASSAVVIAFAFTQSFELPPGFGFLIPPGSHGEDALLAATFVDQKFDCRVPPGARLLRAFFGGEQGARLQTASDAEVTALALEQLQGILGKLPEPALTVVRRLPLSLPQYAVGHLERMATLDARVKRLGGLWLLGNGYRGVGLPDLIRDARAAARECIAV